MTERLRTTRDLDLLDLSRAETAPFNISDGHRDLFAAAGTWAGPTRTWFEPDQPPSESFTTARIEVILGGRFLRMDYQGTVMGKPHAGELLIGYEPDANRFTAVWIDSFHMSPGVLVSAGERRSDGAVSVLGSYPAGGQTWGWRTTLRSVDDDHLLIEAFNIQPGEDEQRAIQMDLTRHRPE
jgi:hypothetical protein